MAITGVSLRAAWSSRVRSGTMGIRSPMASPSPNDAPTRRPVNDPGPVATATLVSLWGATSARIRSMSRGLLAGRNTSSLTDPDPSRIAKALTADDVSTTKITFDPDAATVAALFQAVQVDVSELQAAGIDSDQLEGRTGHRRGRPAASGDSAHERGLARAELSPQEDKVARPQAPAQLLARCLGLLG